MIFGDIATFIGDTDGSNNFAKMKEALGNADDTGTLTNYPAFEFAENYKNQTGSHVSGSSYENGWYIPTIAELTDVWKEKSRINTIVAFCGNAQFSSSNYWTSSQHTTNNYAKYIYFANVEHVTIMAREKNYCPDISGNRVLCIHQFN